MAVPNVRRHFHSSAQITDLDGAVEQTVLSRTVTLTDAQIKTLPTVGVEIMPAPGAGLAILPIYAYFKSHIVTGYTISGGGGTAYWQLFTGDPFGTSRELTDLALFDGGGGGQDSFGIFPIPVLDTASEAGRAVGPFTDVTFHENTAVYLADVWDGVSNYTGGNAANTASITVVYVVVDL